MANDIKPDKPLYPELGRKPRLPKLPAPDRAAGFDPLFYRNGHFRYDLEAWTTDEEEEDDW